MGESRSKDRPGVYICFLEKPCSHKATGGYKLTKAAISYFFLESPVLVSHVDPLETSTDRFDSHVSP